MGNVATKGPLDTTRYERLELLRHWASGIREDKANAKATRDLANVVVALIDELQEIGAEK